MLRKREPVYQALWAGPCDFDEVLISPVMIQDHMPDNMLKALNKVSEHARLMGAIPRRLGDDIAVLRPGAYEPLEETQENSSNPGNVVLDIGDDEAENESPNSTTLIVVDVEVHQRINDEALSGS